MFRSVDEQASNELRKLIIDLKSYLLHHKRMGCRFYPQTRRTGDPDKADLSAGISRGRPWSGPVSSARGDVFESVGSLGSAATLAQIRTVLGECQRCRLSGSRTQIVFGVGNPKAHLVFVGEGPGAEEDRQGQPFVGKAGQLLTDMITKGMKMTRDEVYIANVIKCRPPENRYPQPDEIARCEPFLYRQLEVIRPKVIVALGRCAVQSLTKSKSPMGKIRGRWHEFRGMKLMPTFHPAYLLRNPAEKKVAWEDLKKVIKELEKGADA